MQGFGVKNCAEFWCSSDQHKKAVQGFGVHLIKTKKASHGFGVHLINIKKKMSTVLVQKASQGFGVKAVHTFGFHLMNT